MRKEQYQERVKAGLCVTCQTHLGDNPVRRKCKVCLGKDNKYRKESRTKKVIENERKYRQKVWYKRCVWKSTRKDRLKNRTSEKPVVKPIRLKTLRVLQMNKCFYCESVMQVENRKKSDGLTIERLDNSLPHTTSNVVLCCSKCNCKRLSNEHDISIVDAVDLILERLEQSTLYLKFLQLLSNPIEAQTPSETKRTCSLSEETKNELEGPASVA